MILHLSMETQGTKGVVGLAQWFERMEYVYNISNCTVESQVKGTDITSYTLRFQELALLCGRMFLEESDDVEKYLGGLPDMVRGNVMSYRPKTMQEAIEFANDQMDQKLLGLAERQAENKRKFDDTSRNNQDHQQLPKKKNVARAYTDGPDDKKEYRGSLPKYTRCNYHHQGQCAPQCHKCNRFGHLARDCRIHIRANAATT
ncbi:putative reverse transcriptase domain-containing protein [Tanacetum coccineum]